jgi:predicted PurR-regulated permease PerM
MSKKTMINTITVLSLTGAISALFLIMIQDFLMVLFLAGLFSGLARPLYLRLCYHLHGSRHLASLITLIIISLVFLLPAFLLLAVVFSQAVDVSQSVTPWVSHLNEPGVFADTLRKLPFYQELIPYKDMLIAKAGEAVTLVSRFLISGLSSLTIGTANFFLMLFILLYSMYFLQMDGDRLILKILYYLPLKSHDEEVMLEKFISVTRAMLKGTVLVGVMQGTLAGIAFAVAGVDNAVFWGTIMAVLSVIPSVGSALIWLPASLLLMIQDHMQTGIALALFCGLIVGSLDNVLRPMLVGHDTKMHELMIFFSTLGGIMMFGIVGLLIGPLIASLFITVWDLYGTTFRHVLPTVEWIPSQWPPPPPACSDINDDVSPSSESSSNGISSNTNNEDLSHTVTGQSSDSS